MTDLAESPTTLIPGLAGESGRGRRGGAQCGHCRRVRKITLPIGKNVQSRRCRGRGARVDVAAFWAGERPLAGWHRAGQRCSALVSTARAPRAARKRPVSRPRWGDLRPARRQMGPRLPMHKDEEQAARWKRARNREEQALCDHKGPDGRRDDVSGRPVRTAGTRAHASPPFFDVGPPGDAGGSDDQRSHETSTPTRSPPISSIPTCPSLRHDGYLPLPDQVIRRPRSAAILLHGAYMQTPVRPS